jgi:hypothetical protein
MNHSHSPRFSPRDFFARFFVAGFLTLAAVAVQAQEAQPVHNASPTELQNVQSTLARLERAAEARDANALAFFGASVPADDAGLKVVDRITHVAVSPRGALVRQVYALSIERKPAVVLSSGTQELWLSRAPDGGFALTPQRFVAPADAATVMVTAAQAQLNGPGDDQSPAVLDIVASRIGGRWIALRTQRWEGELTDANDDAGNNNPRDFFVSRMRAAPRNRAVIAHFLLQKGEKSWFGLGAAYDDARRLSRDADSVAALWRDRIMGEDYVAATSHRDFGLTLGAVGLWNEAADELKKAELLQPGLVGAPKLREAENNRKLDPQNVVANQIEAEKNVGLGADHPDYLISALQREQQATPNVLNALRLSLEYSRLADEGRSAAWGRVANDFISRGAVRQRDADWVRLLVDHLKERAELAKIKPSNVLHSALFTARVWPGDRGAIPLLAALEEAQHTVYADFGIPMGNTEVILWNDQSQFARYTTKFAAQGGNEFVAALTLTKLVTTKTGPLVLGEEINTFADTRDIGALFSTVAHEYGHVAVRQLSRGRMVPVWFNEGVATSVEGGYEGYIGRVQRAANAGTLLSMRELSGWNVDGDRAFLAYSQANSIIDYIVQKFGKAAVLEILRQIGRDTAPEDAFRGVLGLSTNELWDRWVQEGIG